MGLIGSSNHNSIWCLDMEGQHVPLVHSGFWLPLQGTIVNRTYGTHKNLAISLFLLTIFGPIYYGRVPRKPVSPPVLSIARLCGLGRSQLSRDHGNIPNPAQNLGKNPEECSDFLGPPRVLYFCFWHDSICFLLFQRARRIRTRLWRSCGCCLALAAAGRLPGSC